MRLVAVSIGASRTIEINGQAVRTAYLKAPVSGCVRIMRSGLEGNETAVHTDAVYAIAAEHYAFWAARLHADAAGWAPGHFGENLTIAGLDELSMRIGDRVRVGAQVELVVAGPRVPCFKLAWRMGQPQSFVDEFARSGRSGVYFAVTREGFVSAGDPVTLVERSRYEPVAQVAQMIFGGAEVCIDSLRALLALPFLSKTVALGLRTRLERLVDAQETRVGRWEGWRKFRIARIVPETAGIRSFHLHAVDGGPLPAYRAGQFLTVRLPGEHAPTRTWSLSDYDAHPASYRISIKRLAAGGVSAWMHDRAAVGTLLDVRAPAGRFVLDRGSFRPLILIAAGVGITPLLAMAKAHVARGSYERPLHLIYCARNSTQQAFRTELDVLARNSHVTVTRVYSAPLETDHLGHHYDLKGHLSLDSLAHLVKDIHIIHGGRRVPMAWYDCDVYLCAPRQMQSSLLAAAAAQGIDPARIATESFAVPDAASPTAGVTTASVTLQRRGRVLTWQAEAGQTLLELLEHHGLTHESGCRLGICHTCKSRLIDGEVCYDVLPEGLAATEVLLCRARPASDAITLDC